MKILKKLISHVGPSATLVIALLAPTGAAEGATSVNYYFPWTAGATATVTQGQSSSPSHSGSNAYAYDFAVLGTDKSVRASAPGTVYAIERGVTGQTGPGSGGNSVVLKHADGTCTRVSHLAYGSVPNLAIGSRVFQGQVLGMQGNTGYTLPVGRGYHVHFMREVCATRQSIDIDFVEKANPVPGATYTSQNPAGVMCNGSHATIVGRPSGETLTGTGGIDVIVGLGGPDTIEGNGGADILCGGSGSDRVSGGTGDDWVVGESGNDTLYGDDGSDHLDGGGDYDTCYGGVGTDYRRSCEIRYTIERTY